MDEILSDLKTLLEISPIDSSKDGILKLYIRKATTMIKGYLNNDSFSIEYIQANFQDAIIQLTYDGYSVKGEESIKQKTQGSRTLIYKDNLGMNIKSVVNMLPVPYVKMR